MTEQAEKDKALADLYDAFAEELKNRLGSKDGASSADLAVIRGFLKDNGITSLPNEGEGGLGGLIKEAGVSLDDLDLHVVPKADTA